MSKRVTIYDIANELGISTATVNRALTGKPKVSADTRELVVRTAERMGFKPNTLARSLARKPVRLAVVGFTSFPEFHEKFLQGARDAAEELQDYNIQVDYFSYDEGASNTPEGDAFLNDTLCRIAQEGYDGALMCAKYCRGVALMREHGVCVATAINDIDASMRRFCVQYNGYVAGAIAAELIYRLMPAGKRVAIASGTFSRDCHGIHTKIEAGFRAQVQEMPLEIAEIYAHYDRPDIAYDETNRVLDAYPDLGAIYVNSFNSLGVIRAVIEHGLAGQLLLITSDIYEVLRGYIQDGVVTASIFQNQYEQGKIGLRMLYRTVAEDLMPEDHLLIMPQIILRSNLNLF